MAQKELKKTILNLEEEIKLLQKQKISVENEGCFSDKEIKEKRKKLNDIIEKMKMLNNEKEGFKKRLRSGSE